MEKVWFVHVNKHHRGPFSDEEINLLIKTGHVDGNTFLWKKGLNDWMKLGQTSEFGQRFFAGSIQKKAIPKPQPLHQKETEKHSSLLRKIGRLNKQRPKRTEPKKKVLESSRDKELDLLAPLNEENHEGPLFSKDQLKEINQDLKKLSKADGKSTQKVAKANKKVRAKQLTKTSAPQLPATPEQVAATQVLPATPEQVEEVNRQITKIPKKKSKTNGGKIALVLLVAIIGVVYFRLEHGIPLFSKPEGMRTADFKRLKRVHNQEQGKFWKAEAAISFNMDKVWLATNQKSSRLLSVLLTSKSDQVLATKPIVVKSRARLENGLAIFKRFEFIRGVKIYPGYYKMVIYDLGKIVPGKEVKINAQSTSKLIEKSVFLSSRSQRSFNKSLEKFHVKIKSDRSKYIKDLIQKNETYLGLMEKLEEKIVSVLKIMRTQNAAKLMQKHYVETSGVLLTRLIQDDEKIYTKLYEQYNDLAKEYQATAKRGRQIGSFMSDLIAQVGSNRRFSSNYRRAQIKKFKEHFAELKEAFMVTSFKLKQTLGPSKDADNKKSS